MHLKCELQIKLKATVTNKCFGKFFEMTMTLLLLIESKHDAFQLIDHVFSGVTAERVKGGRSPPLARSLEKVNPNMHAFELVLIFPKVRGERRS